MVSINVFKVLFVVTHSLYTLFHFFNKYLVLVNFKLKTFCYEFLSESEKAKYLKNRLQKINKKPKHVTVILGAEKSSLKDIAKLLIWCITTQISFISFYDSKDLLSKHREELEYEISQIKRKNDHVIWYNDQHSVYKNGLIGSKVHVKIFTEEDGRKSVVNLVKDLALQDLKKINIEETSHYLSKHYQFPDPDMGLVFGELFTAFNYPPWQLRLTEFFKFDDIKHITIPVFLDLLERYSKCEQRLGT